MRVFTMAVAGLALAMAFSPAQARDLRPKDLQVCKWGAQAAHGAQHSKLTGVTLWRARKAVEARKYSEGWMRKMALGITDQTYKSKSRLSPMAVQRAYYDGCIKHELARK